MLLVFQVLVATPNLAIVYVVEFSYIALCGCISVHNPWATSGGNCSSCIKSRAPGQTLSVLQEETTWMFYFTVLSRSFQAKLPYEVLVLSPGFISSDDRVGSQHPLRSGNLDSFCLLPVMRVRELAQSLSYSHLFSLIHSLASPGHCPWGLTSCSIIWEGGCSWCFGMTDLGCSRETWRPRVCQDNE